MVEEWGGEDNFVQMKRSYTNKRLADRLENRGQLVSEWNMHLVRKFAPIYQVPRSRIARAQLFSPVKRVGPFTMDTYWFNLMIIWLSAVVFYVTLVYDLLQKLANWNQIRKLRKNN
jgi:hypothetical protein